MLELGWDVVKVKEVLERPAGTNSVSDERIMQYAKENKTIIVTKDKGLKDRCRNRSIPFVDLGSPEQEARIVDRHLKEIMAARALRNEFRYVFIINVYLLISHCQ